MNYCNMHRWGEGYSAQHINGEEDTHYLTRCSELVTDGDRSIEIPSETQLNNDWSRENDLHDV